MVDEIENELDPITLLAGDVNNDDEINITDGAVIVSARIGDPVDEVLGGGVKMKLLEFVGLPIEVGRVSSPKAELDGTSPIRHLLRLPPTVAVDAVPAGRRFLGQNVHGGLKQAMIETGKRVVLLFGGFDVGVGCVTVRRARFVAGDAAPGTAAGSGCRKQA